MMTVNRFTLQSLDEKRWNRWVEQSNQGTIFSEATFFNHHDNRLEVDFWVVEDEDGQWVAGCVGREKEGIFISPFGASYGGILTSDRRFHKQEEAILALLNAMKEVDIKRLVLTYPPFAYLKEWNQSYDFILKYYGAKEVQTLISSVSNVSEFELSSLQRPRNVKKAYKEGLVYSSAIHLDTFYDLLLENKRKFDLLPTHSKSEIESLLTLYPDKIYLRGVYDQEKLISAGLNMKCNDRVLLTFYICSEEASQRKRPVDLYLYEVCKEAQDQGLKWVDFGVSMETDTENPMDPRRSLIFFKENFAAIGMSRTRFELVL